jgi:hypothetical protein
MVEMKMMTINKIEERQPAAIPQPLWTSQPPENRWDELRAAFPPALQAEQSESYAAWEYYANSLCLKSFRFGNVSA